MAAQPTSVTTEQADFAHTLPDDFLQCRDFGHTWRPYTVAWHSQDYEWERTLRCVRCLTQRVQVLSASGGNLRSHYVYPEGYVHAGLGRLDGSARDALRLESVVRMSRGELSGVLRSKTGRR